MINEHYLLLNKLFAKIDSNIINILDAGSGRTSLGILLEYYRDAYVEAIIYPGDNRKKDSIQESFKQNKFNIMEIDLCKKGINKNYDLVLAHLLLGEATKWNNNTNDLIKKLLNIKSKFFIIFDYEEDHTIDYNYLEVYLRNNDFEIICKEKIEKNEPQKFDDFIGKNYIAYLIKHKY